jgi:alpha-glucosidase
VPIPPEREQDPFGKNMPGTGQSRDPERTPMQWDASENAGFTTGEPWLPLAADWQVTNVATLRQDPASLLNLVRALTALRRQEPALALGNYHTLAIESDVLIYAREAGSRRFVVALNLEAEPKAVLFKEGELRGRIALSTRMDRGGEAIDGELALRADEGVVIEVAG